MKVDLVIQKQSKIKISEIFNLHPKKNRHPFGEGFEPQTNLIF